MYLTRRSRPGRRASCARPGPGLDRDEGVAAVAAEENAGVLRPAEPGAQVAAEVDEQQQERGCKVLDQRAHERCSLFYPYLGKNGRSSQALAGRNFKSFVSS